MRPPAKKRKDGRSPAGCSIVWVDQEPQRNELLRACREAMARLERVRESWHHFERKDRPAFVRWRAREFGEILSDARETERRITAAQSLIAEVEEEMRRHFQSPQSALSRVKSRRENPGEEEPEPSFSSGTSRPLTEFEQEALFQDWVQKFMGTHPDKMDDEAYATAFDVFKNYMFVRSSKPPPKQNARQRQAEPITPELEPEKERDEETDERLKTLYRQLVRQLHPDARGDGKVEVSMLWHETQEAYAANDVARMEILLALSSLSVDKLGAGTSVGQMRTVLEDLGRSLRALEKSVREAEGEEAWDFARKGESSELRGEVERQLKFDLNHRRRHLASLEQTLTAWQSQRCCV